MWITDYSHLSDRELEAIQARVGKWKEKLKVFIADIIPTECCQRENMEDRMKELESLVTTFWWTVILEHIQKRGIPDYNTYIGSGKLDEIIHEMHLQNANLLIVWNILKPHQIYKINAKLKKIGAVCWDRVDLILKIFEKNAKTEETKLQIRLAAIKHMWPRIFDMGMELGKQWGKGSGETNTEIMKRHLATQEKEIRKKLEGYSKVRENHRKGRKRKWLLTVGIVGYTNAGKSTLLNALTNKGVLSEDKLFATLGTSVGKMWLEPRAEWKYIGTEILLSDTIGFIRDLPPELIDAFASTLEDSIESELLFHTVDCSDPKLDEKLQIVDEILEKIGAKQEKIHIFNKIDRLSKEQFWDIKLRFQDKKPLYISTHTWEGLKELKEYLRKYI